MLEYRKLRLKRQLQESRFRLVHMYEDFASSLYDMVFVATKDVWRMSTNGKYIYFDPDWMGRLKEMELDYMLSHQLMHIKLGHINRPSYYYGDRYHMAADIVANGKLSVYGWKYEKIPHVGKIRYETYLPTVNGADVDSVTALRYIPFDPSVMEPTKRRSFMIDSDQYWAKKDSKEENGTIILSPKDEDPDDLVYDGPTYGGQFKFKIELFPTTGGAESDDDKSNDKENEKKSDGSSDLQMRRIINMIRQESIFDRISSDRGGIERIRADKNGTALNWRSLLHHFVQEEVNDYSFTPPDRRLQEFDFFLPDYNVYNESIKDVYFFIDTSASVTDDILSSAFYEIKSALEQFDGKLEGTLAFFDVDVRKVIPFSGVDDIQKAKPFGGGGTDFFCIFHYLNILNKSNPPASIVIFTDGNGGFPPESLANGIPVLWLMTDNRKAPWGRTVFLG